jgi:type VI secretion system secreted protein VgrG
MRLIEIHNAKLEPPCIALSWQVSEHLSHEPSYRLELLSPDPYLDLDALLGEALTTDIDLSEGVTRRFHSHVLAGSDTGQKGEQYTYALELGSWLSFLAERQNCRIFQKLSVPEILAEVFATHHQGDYRFELEQHYEPREYCVQFRESDLNFVKRLLESEGIYFWVEHQHDRHVIVFSDTQHFVDMAAPYASLRFLPDGEEQRSIDGREGIQRLQRTRRLRASHVALRDFNYLVPANRLDSAAKVEAPATSAPTTADALPLEHYDYAAGYGDVEQGNRLARLRLQALQAQSHQLLGQSNVRGLTVAQAFSLEGHPDALRNRRYFLTATDLCFAQDGPDSASSGRNISANFHALPDNVPFRAPLRTPSPAVPGIQSATVVGPAGSEVHTDKLGRVRVHFHWDRYTSTEEDASCWIRVSQAWAGKGWGMLTLPRVGQEVLITYVDGDLDRPLVTGAVYNGDNPTPYNLPKDIRYSGIVSRSLKQGLDKNASQLTFDDQRGAERLMLHAERDMQSTVERNSAVSVGQDMYTQVEGTTTSETANDIGYEDVKVEYTGTKIDYTGVEITHAGVVMDFIGTESKYIGVGTEFIGVATEFRGVSTEFIGIGTEFRGVSTEYKGISTEFVGLSTEHTGVSVETTGIATEMIGVETSLIGMSSETVGVELSVRGVATELSGTVTSITGSEFSVTGTSIEQIGTSVADIGTETLTVGTATATKGSETTTIGTLTENIGTLNATKGTAIETIGTLIEMIGTKISNEESSEKEIGSEIASFGIQIKN